MADKADIAEYNKSKVLVRALIASIGYFIFGYSNGVFTSSQICVSNLLRWGELHEFYIAVMSAIVPFGALFGALGIGVVSEKLGKRKGLMIADLIAIISSFVLIVPHTFAFGVGRLLSGICVGCFSMLCPQYITEFTPKDIAGKIGSFNALFILSGLMTAFSICLPLPIGSCSEEINYLVFSIFGLPGILAFIQFIALWKFLKDESPYWLIKHGLNEMALSSLQNIYNKNYAEIQFSQFTHKHEQTFEDSENNNNINESIRLVKGSKTSRKSLRLSIIYQILSQLSGINAILAYMTMIFQDFGEGEFISRLLNVIVSFTRLLAVFFVMPYMDKYGKKTISVYSELILGISACILGILLNSAHVPIGSVILMGFYLIIYGVSMGPMAWIFSSEVLNDTQMSICASINWACALIFVLFFPFLIDAVGIGYVFICIGGIDLLGSLYFYFDMLETTGMSKTEIIEMYSKHR